MNLRLTLAATAIAVATLAAAGAQAATLYADAGIGEQATDTSYVASFTAPAGAANLSFTIDGYASLDGQNWYEDDFTLSLNGLAILQGTFNLGGGGNDAVFFSPSGSTINDISGNGTNVTWAGGHVNVSAPITLAGGTNTLTFNYHSLPSNGGQNAGWQDMGDEGWGVSNIAVTSAGGVPEPASWALMLTGFAALGAMVRRSRQLATVTA